MAATDKNQMPPPYSPPVASPDGVTVNMSQPGMSGAQMPVQGQPIGYNQQVYNAGYDQPGDAFPQRQMQMMPTNNVQVTQVNAAPIVMVSNRGADLLVPTILVCICCSPLLGILAIIFAVMANSEFDAGNMQGGNKYNRYAKITMLISVLISVAVLVIYIILAFTVLANAEEHVSTYNTNSGY